MLRTQISLTENERRLLDTQSARTGRSMSSLIREAVTVVYGPKDTGDDRLAALDAAFGSWTDRDFDGAEYVDELRTGERWARLGL